MKKRNHAHAGIAPHLCLGFTGYRGNRSKKCLDVSNGISLVEGFLARVRSVIKVHDLDVSMLSQVVNGVHRPESFCFLCSWPSESSLMLTISGKVDVDGVLTRVAGFPVLRAGRLGETVLSCGKGEDKLEGIDVAVVALVGPPLL